MSCAGARPKSASASGADRFGARWWSDPQASAHRSGTGSAVGVRALVQRVTRAGVTVAGHVVGEIGPGLCVLVGVTHDDDGAKAIKLADKIWNLRIMADDD